MPSPAIAVTIVHGDEDELVPLAVSESYVAAHPRTRLARLRKTGHFAVIDPAAEAWPSVLRELEALA
jgi:pimeloyl-ACP methyl ester carboxylesterase